MSVLLETTRGDVVVDLHAGAAPRAAENFLKLCKARYYDGCLFHNVQRGFAVQTGDPSGTGRGGDSVQGLLHGSSRRFFPDEIRPGLRHDRPGVLGMASFGRDQNGSQFYITTGSGAGSLDGQRTIFGEVAEGMDAVLRIDEALCDDIGRPWQNIRIKRTHVLDDPFPDPPGFAMLLPEGSPDPPELGGSRAEDDWERQGGRDDGTEAEGPEGTPGMVLGTRTAEHEARSRAEVLEMIGDMPDAEAAPEKNMIFVCKLNPVTQEEDLEIIFSRFGKVTSCDIIRDWKTGESLSYGFIGFETDAAAEAAFLKMNNCLIDDRRVHVDFYQSMHHQWRAQRHPGAGGRGGADRRMRGGGMPDGAAVVRSFQNLQGKTEARMSAPRRSGIGGQGSLPDGSRRSHWEDRGNRSGRERGETDRRYYEKNRRASREGQARDRELEGRGHKGRDRKVEPEPQNDVDREMTRNSQRDRCLEQSPHSYRGHDRDRYRDQSRHSDRDRNRERDRSRHSDRGRDRDRDRSRHRDQGRERYRSRHSDQDHDRSRLDDSAKRLRDEDEDGMHRGHRRRRHRSDHHRHRQH